MSDKTKIRDLTDEEQTILGPMLHRRELAIARLQDLQATIEAVNHEAETCNSALSSLAASFNGKRDDSVTIDLEEMALYRKADPVSDAAAAAQRLIDTHDQENDE